MIRCSEIADVEEATVISAAEANYADSIVTYQCNDGYILYQDGVPLYSVNNTFNMICKTDYDTFTGKWMGNYSCECKCVKLNVIFNAWLNDCK